MSTSVYHEVLEKAQTLSPEEKLQLAGELIEDARHYVIPRRKHSVMEFQGMAKKFWEGVDVAKYIDEERNSWDG